MRADYKRGCGKVLCFVCDRNFAINIKPNFDKVQQRTSNKTLIRNINYAVIIQTKLSCTFGCLYKDQ